MKFLSRCLALVGLWSLSAFGVLGAGSLPETPLFAHAESDLKVDSRIRFGQLPNGLRYALLPNQEPRERVSFRLLVMAGSLHEEDDQQGLAHFLEHMAFNGSANYPAGTLIEFFQRMGMSFGGDTNAHTSFDHTAYLLELPHNDPKTTEEGFRVFADYASTLTLADAELDRERGIILSEKRDRDTVGLREWVAEASYSLAGTRFPQRLPIGTTEVIQQAPRERFVSFYDTWYRPERMAVIVVGDIDAAVIEQQLIAAFSPLTARGPARSSPALGAIPPREELGIFHHHEKESGATRVSIQVIRDWSGVADTIASRRERLPRSLAATMLSRRLEILARTEGAPFTRGEASLSREFDLWASAGIELSCRPEQWQAALTLAENELRRALQYGFTEAELAEARANFRNDLEQAARTAATRRSDQLADQLMDALLAGDVFTTPADDLAVLEPALNTLTPAECTDALREAFSGAAPIVTVIGNVKVGESTDEAKSLIAGVFAQASSAPVTPPVQEKVVPFAYTAFGEEGNLAIGRHIEDLDVHLATLGNGVKLNLKKTDFEQGKIRLLLRVGGGQLTQPLDQPGLNLLADYAFFSGGLGKHSYDELQRVLAGRSVSLQVRTAGDAFLFLGETNREDLLLNLQLFAAYLTDAGYRPESLLLVRKQLEQFYTQLEHVPEGPLQLDLPRFLAQGDPRFGFPRRNESFARTLEELKAWLQPQFARGPMELSIVGDLDLEATRTAVLKTLGALPKRDAKPPYTEERKASFPAPTARAYPFVSDQPKAYSYIAWPTTDNRDITTTRQLNLLANVFTDRLRTRVREELGDAYSPFALSAPSDTYTQYGLFAAVVSGSADKTEKINEVILAIARDLIEKGVTADETERAKQPVLTSIREAARTNPYWLQTVLSSAQEIPQRLDWRRTIESGHASITAEQLHTLAKRFLAPERAFRITTQPGTTPAPEPTPAPQFTKPRAKPTPLGSSQGQTRTPTPTPLDDF